MRTLDDVKTALLTVTDNVRHFWYINPPATYLVYAEDLPGDTVNGDGKQQKQTLQGTVDLYTKELNAGYPKRVQKALNDAGIPNRVNSIQGESETGILHYEWVFEVASDLIGD